MAKNRASPLKPLLDSPPVREAARALIAAVEAFVPFDGSPEAVSAVVKVAFEEGLTRVAEEGLPC